jgi:hypothetical protein
MEQKVLITLSNRAGAGRDVPAPSSNHERNFPVNRVSSLCRAVGSSNMGAAMCGDLKNAEGRDWESAPLYAVKFHRTLDHSKEQ